jgi:hypothetical protein
MKFVPMTGGDGDTGQDGLEILTIVNKSLTGLIGNIASVELVEETFNWSNLTAYENNTLVITHDYDLANGNITIPAGVTMLFNGGWLKNVGTITGNNTRIINVGSQQCFDDDVTFAGTWSETICNYQWFGAKSVPTRTSYILEFECSAAINKAHNSPFKVDPVPGFYYITSPLIYNTPKFLNFGIAPLEHEDDILTAPDTLIPDHVRFITDQDINIFDLRRSGINIIGGTIDVKGVGTYTKDCIKVRAQVAKIVDGSLYKINIVGDQYGNSRLGASGKAFHFDTSDNTVYGFLANMEINLLIRFIPYGVYIDKPDYGNSSTWCGVNRFFVVADGCKQGFVVKGGFNRYEGYTQTRDILDISEQDLYQAEFEGGNKIYVDCWDLYPVGSQYNPAGDSYLPSKGMLIKSDNQTVETFTHLTFEKHYTRAAALSVSNKTDITLLADKGTAKGYISELHNKLIALNKTNPASIKYYSGAAIDFDSLTPTIGSETEITNISGTYVENLFTGKGYAPVFVYNGSTDPDKDFIEIAFTGISYYSATQIFHLLLEGTRSICKRIQIIGFKSSGNPNVVNIYPDSSSVNYAKASFKGQLPGTSYTAYAIRIIGSGNIKKAATISNATPGVVTCVGHAMSGSFQFGTTGTLPAPLLPNTTYYIVNATDDTFNVSLTSGGAAIATTNAGSGTHYISKVTSLYISDIALQVSGNLDGSNFQLKIDDYRYKYSAVISQVGAAAPTLAAKLNTFPSAPAFSAYSSQGDFTLTHSGYVTLAKMDITNITLNIYEGLTFIGTIWIQRTNDNSWRIRTYNPAGELADGIINGFRLNYNFAW